MPKGRVPANAFRRGCKPGPGRPRGSRDKLSQALIDVLSADFEKHGQDVVRRVREKQPGLYLNAMISLAPRVMQQDRSIFNDISDAELALMEEFLVASRARLVRQIEHAAEDRESTRLNSSQSASRMPSSA